MTENEKEFLKTAPMWCEPKFVPKIRHYSYNSTDYN